MQAFQCDRCNQYFSGTPTAHTITQETSTSLSCPTYEWKTDLCKLCEDDLRRFLACDMTGRSV